MPENDKDKTDDKDTKDSKDSNQELSDLKASYAALSARFEKLEKQAGKGKEDDTGGDLSDQALRKQADDERRTQDSKALEAALRFSLTSSEFIKTNAALLPKEVSEIFAGADKETYESPIEKDQAIKRGLIESFFKVQSNLDLLTPGLKTQLEDYLKLTKNGKQEKAQQIYDMVFEPSLEMLRRLEKAKAVSKTGYTTPSDSESAYRQKLMKGSRKHYMGEKET
jgi:hypothetical protein